MIGMVYGDDGDGLTQATKIQEHLQLLFIVYDCMKIKPLVIDNLHVQYWNEKRRRNIIVHSPSLNKWTKKKNETPYTHTHTHAYRCAHPMNHTRIARMSMWIATDNKKKSKENPNLFIFLVTKNTGSWLCWWRRSVTSNRNDHTIAPYQP